jgi:hypothetical protein
MHICSNTSTHTYVCILVQIRPTCFRKIRAPAKPSSRSHTHTHTAQDLPAGYWHAYSLSFALSLTHIDTHTPDTHKSETIRVDAAFPTADVARSISYALGL